MKMMIVDDEPAMRLTIEQMVKRMDDVEAEIVGSFADAAEAIAFVKEQQADLAFVDIQIAEDNGLELARMLREIHADLDIVFITSHREFALDAFEAYPLDYIVKPISKQRLAQTVTRACEKRQARHKPSSEQPAVSRLSVRGLGSMRAFSGHAGEVKWLSRKSQELFAYLLMYRGESAGKGQILKDIFPERSLKSAETYLHTAVYQLRRALAPHGLKEIVRTANEQYRLELNHVNVDFIEFERAANSITGLHDDQIADALMLESRYAADLFEDKSYEWSLVERDRLAIVYETCTKKIIQALMERHRLAEAKQLIIKLIARNELDEELNASLLTLYGMMNKKQLLHSHYEQYCALLRRELNLAPSHEITSVYERYKG